ncbi:MAG: hypothetical protein U9Q22_00295 [Candidatus Altiarchaeota archaeon]|nr:hypothetical protein [Candidatus Altiarchaeota archaeon]
MNCFKFTRTRRFDERLNELDPALRKRILIKLQEFQVHVND